MTWSYSENHWCLSHLEVQSGSQEAFSQLPGGSVVKNPPATQETQVQSLGQDDPLEKRMATQSVFLPGKSRGWRSLAGCSPRGLKDSDTTEQLSPQIR